MNNLNKINQSGLKIKKLISAYRKCSFLNLTPFECIFELSRECPNSIIVQQIVLKEKDQSDDDDSLLYITKILIEKVFYFEAIAKLKTVSVNIAAKKVIYFLKECIVEQDAEQDEFNQFMVWQSMPWLRSDPNYDFEQTVSENETNKISNSKTIENLSKLLKLYLQEYFKYETELSTFNKLVFLKKNLFKVTYELPWPPVATYLCQIQIEGCPNSKFTANSWFGCDDARKNAAVKLVCFLNGIISLVQDFKNIVNSKTTMPFKTVVQLLQLHSNIIKIVKSGSNLAQNNSKFSTKIEIVNVVTVEEFGKKNEDIAAEKIVFYLKSLSNITCLKNKSLNQIKLIDKSMSKTNNNFIETIEIVENNLNHDKQNKNKKKKLQNKLTFEENSNEQISSIIKNDKTMTGIKKKLESAKEVIFKQKLIRVFNNAQKKNVLEILKHLRNNGINLEVSQTFKNKRFETKIKFRDFANSLNFPEFCESARKKIDSKKACANKLVVYLKKLSNDNKGTFNSDTLDKGESIANDLNDKSNEQDDNLKQLLKSFKSLNILKQSELEIIDMLKSKGEQIEIEQSFENDEHQTIIKAVGMKFSSTDSKKAQSKRLAANKFIEFLKASLKKQSKNDLLSDESDSDESENDETDESVSEKEEEPIVKREVNNFQTENLPILPKTEVTPQTLKDSYNKTSFSDADPLWGHHKQESPFIVNQKKQFKQGSKTQMIDELKKRYFGDDFEGPSDDKIEKLILLIKRFDSVKSLNKTKTQTLQDLKASGQPMKIVQDVVRDKYQRLTFTTTVDIYDIVKFGETSFDPKSPDFILSRALRFLKNLSHLVKNFWYFYNKTKFPVEIIESLMIDNFEMLKIVEDKRQSNGFYKVAVEATRIGTFTGINHESSRAKEIAMTKVCFIIMRLAGIPNGTLKVNDYIAIKPLESKEKTSNQVHKQFQKLSIETEEDEELTESKDSQDENPTYSDVFKKNTIILESKTPNQKDKSEFNALSSNPNSIESVAKLICYFRKATILNANTLESQMSVLEYLQSQGVQIKMTKEKTGNEFSLTIEIENVTSFTAKAKTELKSKEEAVDKMIGFLKNLLELVDGQLKSESKETVVKNSPKENEDKIVGDEQKKTDQLDLLLKLYENVCINLTNPTQILDALIAQTANLTGSNNQLLQCNQINLGKGQPCITTISLYDDTLGHFQVFSATSLNQAESKNEAAIKLVHFLTNMLQQKLEQKLDLKQLIKDSSLLLNSDISKRVYEAVKLQWSNLGNFNTFLQFKNLAAFVVTSETDDNFAKVLSIGTGSQSNNSKTALPYNGQAVLDCHAGVIARRALLCYLYEQINELLSNSTRNDLIFEIGKTGFRLKESLKLHLYMYNSPCVDKSSKYGLFKPCADKIKVWNVLGLQGSLLSAFTEPLYLSSVVVSDLSNFEKLTKVFYDGLDSNLLGAFLESVQLNEVYKLNRHQIGYYKNFNDSNFQAKTLNEFFVSHNWYNSTNSMSPINSIELLHAQYGTVINQQQPSRLSKQTFVQLYQKLTQKYPVLLEMVKLVNPEPSRDEFALYYRGLKNSFTKYQKVKKALENTFVESDEVGEWIRAPIHVDLFIL